jgi:hypothetical protein
VELKELTKIEFGSFQNLHFADIAMLKRINAMGSLLNLLSNHLWDEFLDNLLQIARGRLSRHNLKHLLADLSDLGVGCVGGLADLVGAALGESNGEDSEEVAVGCLDINMGLNQGLFSIQRKRWLKYLGIFK